MNVRPALLLLIVALVLALIGAILAFGWLTDSQPDGSDLFGVLFLSLSAYFASLLAPR